MAGDEHGGNRRSETFVSLDPLILLRTVAVVLRRRGAY